MDSPYIEIAEEIGRLVAEKQAFYGESVYRAPEILALMYPDGVKPQDYRDLMMITRVIDKLFRIATSKGAYGEDPWRDIAGYAILSVTRNQQDTGRQNGDSLGC